MSGVDLFPTLLARAGVRSVPKNDGKDLLRLVTRRGSARHHDIIFAESVNRAICAAWEGDGKLVWIPDDRPQDWSVPERMMWFNLPHDPSESSNLIDSHAGDASRLKAKFEKAQSQPAVRLEAYRGSADIDRLKALGYVH